MCTFMQIHTRARLRSSQQREACFILPPWLLSALLSAEFAPSSDADISAQHEDQNSKTTNHLDHKASAASLSVCLCVCGSVLCVSVIVLV